MSEEQAVENENQNLELEAEGEEAQETQEEEQKGPNLEDLSPEALRQAYQDSQRKLAKASKQAAKYRTERNTLKEAADKARKDAELAKLEELDRLKAQIAERDKLVEQAKLEAQDIKKQMKRSESLTGKVTDLNLAVVALNSLSSDEREQIENDEGFDFESLFEKFPALRPQKAKPSPSKGGGGSVKTEKLPEDMSDAEFYKTHT